MAARGSRKWVTVVCFGPRSDLSINHHPIAYDCDPGRPVRRTSMQLKAAWPKPLVWMCQAESHIKEECVDSEIGAILDLFTKA